MPVTATRFAVMLLSVLAVAGLGAPAAEAVVAVRAPEQLSEHPNVRKFVGPYRRFTSANVLFARCGVEWQVTDEQRAYLNHRFETTSRGYLQAYVDAYTERLRGHAPPQDFIDGFTAIILGVQQKEVKKMTAAIDQVGCADKKLRPMYEYIESLRLNDIAQGKYTPASPAVVPAPVAAPAADVPPAVSP